VGGSFGAAGSAFAPGSLRVGGSFGAAGSAFAATFRCAWRELR
jgi:hypothetical protein